MEDKDGPSPSATPANPEQAKPCWYWDKEDLAHTPSRREGLDPATEARYRREGARFIFDAGIRLGLCYDTLATGVIYFHRFYMFRSFKQFPRYVTGACCLFLAGKVEETPKKCKDIIKTARGLLSDAQFGQFGEDPREEVMVLERILLQTIKFDLQVEHPYHFLLKYATRLNGSKKKLQKLVQMAWTFVNDSLCTTLSLQWEPEIVAVAVMYLAGRLCRFQLQEWAPQPPPSGRWWEQFVEDLHVDVLEDICHQILDIYSQGKHQVPHYSSPRLQQPPPQPQPQPAAPPPSPPRPPASPEDDEPPRSPPHKLPRLEAAPPPPPPDWRPPLAAAPAEAEPAGHPPKGPPPPPPPDPAPRPPLPPDPAPPDSAPRPPLPPDPEPRPPPPPPDPAHRPPLPPDPAPRPPPPPPDPLPRPPPPPLLPPDPLPPPLLPPLMPPDPAPQPPPPPLMPPDPAPQPPLPPLMPPDPAPQPLLPPLMPPEPAPQPPPASYLPAMPAGGSHLSGEGYWSLQPTVKNGGPAYRALLPRNGHPPHLPYHAHVYPANPPLPLPASFPLPSAPALTPGYPSPAPAFSPNFPPPGLGLPSARYLPPLILRPRKPPGAGLGRAAWMR